jgi:hypothetical protein
MDSMGGLLTRGLGAPACCGLILARFSLAKCCQYTIVVTPPEENGGGGGSIPLSPGEIHNFYTPVGQPNPLKPLEYLTPYKSPVPVEKITITLSMKNSDGTVDNIEREYYVPQYRSKVILNVTRFSVSVYGLTIVTASNLKNKIKASVRVVVDKLRKR